MEVDISAIVLASIGWTLVLTAAVIAAVFAVNYRFSCPDRKFEAIDRKFEAMDRRFDALQNLILCELSR